MTFGPLSLTTPRRAWAVALALFLLAFAPRAVALARFVTWDELFWTRAALEFHRELDGQDWEGTYVIGQPGVVTMWLGAGALALRGAVAGRAARDQILEAGQLKYRDDDAATMLALAGHWRGLPIAVALFTSLAVALTFLWLRPLWGDGAAPAAGILLAMEPFYVAHSRVFALDAVLASLCLLSLVALARWVADGHRRWLVAGAVLAGLATLNKVPALGLVAWGTLVIGIAGWRRDWRHDRSVGSGSGADLGEERASIARGLRAAALWLVAAMATIFVAWPALWVAPIETLGKVSDTLRTYQGSAYDAMFFAGTAGVPPGPWFYPAVALYRLSPLVLLGGVALAWLARAARASRAVEQRRRAGRVQLGLLPSPHLAGNQVRSLSPAGAAAAGGAGRAGSGAAGGAVALGGPRATGLARWWAGWVGGIVASADGAVVPSGMVRPAAGRRGDGRGAAAVGLGRGDGPSGCLPE